MGLTAFGGYQAEINWAMIGLDIEERMKLPEAQLRHTFGKSRMAKFTFWDITAYGSAPENPRNQNSCLLDVRLFAQAKNEEDPSEANFIRPALDINMREFPYPLNLETC